MKAEAKTTTPTFKPVTLTLTFETQGELDSFFAIMSHERVVKGGEFSGAAYEIRVAILKCVDDLDRTTAFLKLDKHLSFKDQ